MCEHLDLGGGNRAIICGTKAKVCRFCRKRFAKFLCDWKIPGGNGKTCDAPMCRSCAINVGPEKDLCPPHAKAWHAWKRAHPEHPAVAQMAMFPREVA